MAVHWCTKCGAPNTYSHKLTNGSNVKCTICGKNFDVEDGVKVESDD